MKSFSSVSRTLPALAGCDWGIPPPQTQPRSTKSLSTGFRREAIRNSLRLPPSRRYGSSGFKSGRPCSTTPCHKSTCPCTMSGTTTLPPFPGCHTGACHGSRLNDPCIRSRVAFVLDGCTCGLDGIAPVAIRSHSSAEYTSAIGLTGRTRSCHRSRYTGHAPEN